MPHTETPPSAGQLARQAGADFARASQPRRVPYAHADHAWTFFDSYDHALLERNMFAVRGEGEV